METPHMISKKQIPLAIFQVNGKFILAVYKGSLSEFDIIVKYRQRDESRKSGWTLIRMPKHIHWTIDILIKLYADEVETKRLVQFLLDFWQQAKPIKSNAEQEELLQIRRLLEEVTEEAKNYPNINTKGEYSVKFLLLMLKLLAIQEKTNNEDAFMFKDLLSNLLENKDIYKLVSIATHNSRR